MLIVRVSLLILVSLFSSSVFGQSAQNLINPDRRKLSKDWEAYSPHPPVSGAVRVGLMANESEELIPPSSFFVNIPERQKQATLCVEISSRDGRYQAKLPYDVSGYEAKTYAFALPTRFNTELKKYAVKDITILSKICKTCDEEALYYVISGWHKPEFSTNEFYLYLNSRVYTDLIFANPSSGATEKIKCAETNGPSDAAYGCLCKIPLAQIRGVKDISIRRLINVGGKVSYSYYELPIKF